jgi:hypothetical protein
MITNGIPAYWKKKQQQKKENSRKLIWCVIFEIKLLIFKENSGISAFKI